MAGEHPPYAEESGADKSGAEHPPDAEESGAEESGAENSPHKESGPEDRPAREQAGPGGGTGDGTGAGAAEHRAALHRSANDRVIAGVAGGLGEYFGIDPVIVRIGFVVLTFLGGAGPFLYLVGWLALPRAGSGSIITDALGGDAPHRLRSVLVVVLIGLGLLVIASLSGELFELFVNVWTASAYLALILIAAGVALVLWPRPAASKKSTAARPPASAAPAPPAHASSPAAGPQWPVSPGAAGGAESWAKRSRRRRSAMGALTVAALLIYVGAAVVLDRLDMAETDVVLFFAVALMITGAGLAVSAFTGPARGLILLGLGLCAPLLLFAGADVSWGSGMGEIRVSATDADELEGEYRHGVGRMVVDLRGLEPDGAAKSLAVSLGVGEVLVYVPDDIRTVAEVNVGAGSIRELYNGPWADRAADAAAVQGLVGHLLSLEYEGEADFDDVDDYLDAYEGYSGLRMTAGERLTLLRLLDNADFPGGVRPRDRLAYLFNEARRGFDTGPWEAGENGLGLSRRITAPLRGEPAGELSLDIDVGIGEVRVVTVAAPDRQEATSP